MSQKIHSSMQAGLHNHILGLPQGVEWQVGTILARDNAAVFEGQWSGGGDSRREESVPLHSAGGEDQY